MIRELPKVTIILTSLAFKVFMSRIDLLHLQQQQQQQCLQQSRHWSRVSSGPEHVSDSARDRETWRAWHTSDDISQCDEDLCQQRWVSQNQWLRLWQQHHDLQVSAVITNIFDKWLKYFPGLVVTRPTAMNMFPGLRRISKHHLWPVEVSIWTIIFLILSLLWC